MGYFPFFMDLEGKDGLVVGGGTVAKRKVEKLVMYGPHLQVISPDISDDIKRIEGIKCELREFEDSDIEGKMFVIAATDDEFLNSRISGLCRDKGIPVNVVDDINKCSFIFPSVVKNGHLSIGISTEGTSPRIASRIKLEIIDMLPSNTEEILDYLQEKRAETIQNGKYSRDESSAWDQWEDIKKERSRYLCSLADRCFDERKCVDKDINSENSTKGFVSFVGAGCGTWEYITVKGINEIKKADAILYDALIDEKLLLYAKENCRFVCVGKRGNKPSVPQEKINELLVELSLKGLYVVRLKGGDPFVFGRGGEEILRLRAEGIDYSVTPGISSCIAVPEIAGIPVTHRNISRSFMVITGNTSEEKLPKDIYNSVNFEGTVIILMGLSHLKEIVDVYIQGGRPADTAIAVINNDCSKGITSVRATLEDVVEKVEKMKINPPGVIVIGDVVEVLK